MFVPTGTSTFLRILKHQNERRETNACVAFTTVFFPHRKIIRLARAADYLLADTKTVHEPDESGGR
jgi:hypothetical protein